MSDLRILPNVEALVSAFLRSHPDVVGLIAERVYTVIPANPAWPLVRVHQWDDQPAGQRPLHHVASYLQIDAFGGTKAQAHRIASTCRAALAAELSGSHSDGIVSGVDTRGLTDDPDQTYSPAKPRWRFDCIVYNHPLRGTPAS